MAGRATDLRGLSDAGKSTAARDRLTEMMQAVNAYAQIDENKLGAEKRNIGFGYYASGQMVPLHDN